MKDAKNYYNFLQREKMLNLVNEFNKSECREIIQNWKNTSGVKQLVPSPLNN